jgi:hypothetical protein
VPPGLAPADIPLPPGAVAVPSPAPVPAPVAFEGGAASGSTPSVAIAKYNPRTGEYMGGDGKMYRQSDLVTSPKTWQELMPT